jgi:hypothetical protein
MEHFGTAWNVFAIHPAWDIAGKSRLMVRRPRDGVRRFFRSLGAALGSSGLLGATARNIFVFRAAARCTFAKVTKRTFERMPNATRDSQSGSRRKSWSVQCTRGRWGSS